MLLQDIGSGITGGAEGAFVPPTKGTSQAMVSSICHIHIYLQISELRVVWCVIFIDIDLTSDHFQNQVIILWIMNT